jgi:hypothetical protein
MSLDDLTDLRDTNNCFIADRIHGGMRIQAYSKGRARGGEICQHPPGKVGLDNKRILKICIMIGQANTEGKCESSGSEKAIT